MTIHFAVQAERHVKMIRPETGIIQLVFTTTEKFDALDYEQKKEWSLALTQERSFHCGSDGELSFTSDDLRSYFTIKKESENWEYNGGECSIIHEEYEHHARRK